MTKQSTKTVSSCCKAPIITMQASEGTGYYVCSKCHIGCDSTPTHSHTETVSDCCGATTYLAGSQSGGERCCDKCHKRCGVVTAPTEYTADKWEIYLREVARHFGTERTPDGKDWMWPRHPSQARLREEYHTTKILDYLSNHPYQTQSVQEAKAGRDEMWKKEIYLMTHPDPSGEDRAMPTSPRANYDLALVDLLENMSNHPIKDDLLTSLRKERGEV